MWIKTIYFKNRSVTISSFRLNLIFDSLLNYYSNFKTILSLQQRRARGKEFSPLFLARFTCLRAPVWITRARSAPGSIECRLPKCIIIYLIYKPADLIGICHMWHNSFSQVNFSTNSSAMLCNNNISEKEKPWSIILPKVNKLNVHV